MNLQKCELSTQVWCDNRLDIMRIALQARYEQDEDFKEIIDFLKGKNKKFFHFERSVKSFWGGNRPKKLGSTIWVGQNNLGLLIDELGSQ